MDSDNNAEKQSTEQHQFEIANFPLTFPATEQLKLKMEIEEQQLAETSGREDQNGGANENANNDNDDGEGEEDSANNNIVDILNNGCTSNALQQLHQFPFIHHQQHYHEQQQGFGETMTNGGNGGGASINGGNRENGGSSVDDDYQTPPPPHHQNHHQRRPSSCSQHSHQQQHFLKEELLDSGDELPPAEEVETAPIHEIRCGLLTARLHMRRFTCPGIHRKCVEFEGKLISPRQFTIKAEKDKQKDWKGSIRLGKHNLRTLMEMKTLDFYEHATNCSLKCQSRNYIKNRKGCENGGGGDGQPGQMMENAGNGNGHGPAFELMGGEPNDIKSVASSSSAASTRKSSAAVLEDFVSQQIPSMAFGGCGADQFPLNGANGGEEETMQGNGQNGHKTSTPPLANLMHRAPPPQSTTPHHHQQNVLHNSAAVPVSLSQQHSQSPFHPVNSMNLLQQSPLKQLFGAGTTGIGSRNHQNQPPQIVHSNSTNSSSSTSTPSSSILPSIHHHHQSTHLANGGNNNRMTTALGMGGGGAIRGASTDSTNGIHHHHQQQQDAAALALLLQSVQTSILLEQQQKAQQHHQQHQQNGSTNSANGNAGILAQLLSINNALHSQQPQTAAAINSPNHHHLANNNASSTLLAAALNGGNANNALPLNAPMNGIERLLAAAALFPQFQPANTLQPKSTMTPLKEPTALLAPPPPPPPVLNAQNIRKSMEENPSLFWSHMRNMGLLEDLLKILSEMLEKLKQIYLHGGNAVSEEFAAQRLSGVALALDLSTLFGEKVHSRYIQATLESTLINKEILELQRKQEEQKRKLENAKRKSQCFDQLLKNGTGNGRSNGPMAGHRNGGGGQNGGGALENGSGGPELKKIHLNI